MEKKDSVLRSRIRTKVFGLYLILKLFKSLYLYILYCNNLCCKKKKTPCHYLTTQTKLRWINCVKWPPHYSTVSQTNFSTYNSEELFSVWFDQSLTWLWRNFDPLFFTTLLPEPGQGQNKFYYTVVPHSSQRLRSRHNRDRWNSAKYRCYIYFCIYIFFKAL